jgi:succinate dehydrogenase flavin-adding protein (antitoxin of CptAB toxin-antitoxin module)
MLNFMPLIQKNILAKKLLYQSKNRGSKEMEVIMSAFIRKYLDKMNLEELQEFSCIVNQLDSDLYDWISKKSTPPKNLLSQTMKKLLSFKL